MQITIISDCSDDNARSRQKIRYKALLGNNTNLTFVGVNHELEASGCLVDVIDAYNGTEGIIVVNVAPRGDKEKYLNGIPFCFSKVGNLIIVGTPNCFSLAKKLGIMTDTFETDVRTVCSKFLSQQEADTIANSQFRSFEYLPRLSTWVFEGDEIPAQQIAISDFGETDYVWYVDCFGNCKTTLVYEVGKEYSSDIQASFIERLTDVPKDGKVYFTKGSSGYKNRRFIELVIQKQNAAQQLNLGVGSKI